MALNNNLETGSQINLNQNEIRRAEQIRTALQTYAKMLVDAGMVVNWANSEGCEYTPRLIVDDKLDLVLITDGRVSGKFWYIEDQTLKDQIRAILGDKVKFADYCFDIGMPSIGDPVF